MIIGAGFAGLGLAMRLKDGGDDDFLVLEQSDGVGGTWWVNRYPGCACDVQSHLYSLSFAPKPDWTRHFAPRAEIQRYLAACAQQSDLHSRIRLNTKVTEARWNESDGCWELTDQHGQRYRCQFLVTAIGGLSRPALPSIPGIDTFSGRVFHSQQWPETVDLSDRNVAVIGGGASAIQFVPEIAPKVAKLDLYQRTPQWILPKPDRPIPAWRQRLYRGFPPARLLTRLGLYLLLESRLPAFNRFPRLTAFHRRKALNFLARQIENPDLRRTLTPDYAMGCKRVLMSNDFYPALNRDNVELISGAVARITPNGVIDRHGIERRADTLILATGFQATNPIPEGMIIGRDQRDLGVEWRDGPSAYKGTCVHGFPNLFMLLGPNTALGHNSVLLMIEAQINYLLDMLQSQRRASTSVEVKNSAQEDWNRRLDRKLARTVWNRGGCASWYLHPVSGRNTTLWPDFTLRFRHQTRRFDPEHFRIATVADK